MGVDLSRQHLIRRRRHGPRQRRDRPQRPGPRAGDRERDTRGEEGHRPGEGGGEERDPRGQESREEVNQYQYPPQYPPPAWPPPPPQHLRRRRGRLILAIVAAAIGVPVIIIIAVAAALGNPAATSPQARTSSPVYAQPVVIPSNPAPSVVRTVKRIVFRVT